MIGIFDYQLGKIKLEVTVEYWPDGGFNMLDIQNSGDSIGHLLNLNAINTIEAHLAAGPVAKAIEQIPFTLAEEAWERRVEH